MPTIIVASKNPVKRQAVQAGFTRMFPGTDFEFQGVSVPSGVRDQPFTSAETLQGAYNRALGARELHPQADYWVGVEGGIEEIAPAAAFPADDSQSADSAESAAKGTASMIAFAWVVVLSEQQMGKGRTGEFDLPPRVAALVRQGKELGEADDIVFGRANSKQENGAVGLLTGDVIDRAAFYEQAVILALIPFRNPDLYSPSAG